nr:MAG TPA: hypothetical protein [Caudoviricetes sp.]DAW73534.1 MAG TPA: hypothetical protein [Caudoviricetes sp.]DAX26126.1 MAG TPA: hypothetical protein [Caudoviricetes sp.]
MRPTNITYHLPLKSHQIAQSEKLISRKKFIFLGYLLESLSIL